MDLSIEMTPTWFAGVYKECGLTTMEEIIGPLKVAIGQVERRLDAALMLHPPHLVAELTRDDRKLYKAQLRFLEHLEGKRRP